MSNALVSVVSWRAVSMLPRTTGQRTNLFGRNQQRQQQSLDVKTASLHHAGLPPILQRMNCGELAVAYRTTKTCNDDDDESVRWRRRNVTVECISHTPPMFVLRNLLSHTECDAIVSLALSSNTMAPGQTASGCKETVIRKNSQVTWLGNDNVDGLIGMLALSVRQLLTDQRESVGVEDMQVVQYDRGGEYVLHHDGNHRFLTVLYYLSGHGETWFPLANDKATTPASRHEALDYANTRQPGIHGILVSTSRSGHEEQVQSRQSSSMVSVHQGDAIAFYNYLGDGQMDWSTIHAGLPASTEKVIANHFFRYTNAPAKS